MATPSAILQVMVAANTTKARNELRRFDAALGRTDKSTASVTARTKEFGGEMDSTSVSMSRAGKGADGLNSRLINLNQAFTGVRNAAGLIKWPAMIAGVGYAAQGVGALTAGVTALTGALAPLVGLGATGAAAMGAFGQAAGVMALSNVDDLTAAVGGLNEKMDQTSTEFKKLSPQGQALAKQLNQLKGPFQDLQARVQEPLFAGMADGIDAALKNMRPLRRVLEITAGAMGDLARRAGEFVGRKGFGRDFREIGFANARLLKGMGAAAMNLGDALRHVMVAAVPLTDWMTRTVVKLSQYVKESARAGRESGALGDFFEQTKNILRTLGPLLSDFGQGLWNVIRIGAPLGNTILRTLADSAKEFRKWTESARGENTIAQWFEDAKGPLFEMGRLLRDIGAAFFDLGDDKGLVGLIRTLRLDVLPVLVDVVKGTTAAFGPTFVKFMGEAVQAMKPFFGATGPLVLFVKALTKVLELFNAIVREVPILGTVLATVFGAQAVSKLVGRFSGLLSGGLFGLAGGGLAERIGTRFGTTFGGAAGPVAAGLIASAVAGAVVGSKLNIGQKELGMAERLKSLSESGGLKQFIKDSAAVGKAIEEHMIRKMVKAGEISAQFGGKLIHEIRQVRQAAARAQADFAEDEGFGIARAFAQDGKLLPKEINNAMRAIDALPPKMRKKAVESMAHFTAGLEASGQLPKGATEALIDRLGEQWKQLPEKVRKNIQGLAGSVSKETKRAGDAAAAHFDNMKVDADRSSRKVVDSWTGDLWPKVQRDAQEKGGKFGRSIRQSFWGGANASAEAMAHMAGETNKTLKTLGGAKGKDVYVAKIGASKMGTFQAGGVVVPGQGTGDKVPAMLEPGEVVLNRKAVSALGGANKANAANKAVPRFAAGGTVGGATSGLHPGILGLVNSLKSFGATVTSGVRGSDSGSLHSTGQAADVSFANWAGASRAVNRVGSKLLEGIYNPGMFGGQPVSWDSGQKVSPSFWGGEWANHLDHIHLAIADGTKAMAGAIKELERVAIKGPKGRIQEMAQGASDMVHAAANKFLAEQTPALSEGSMGLGVSIDGPVQSVFAKVAKRLSTSKVATLALGEAGFAESGMRDLSYGDSTSQGALQLLSSTAAGMGINPHDEGAIASAFLLRGYYGKGGANKLAGQGLAAHLVAQGVQGSATPSGSNYAAQEGPARAWMKRYGLKMGGIVQKLAEGGPVLDVISQIPGLSVDAGIAGPDGIGGAGAPDSTDTKVATGLNVDLKKFYKRLRESKDNKSRRVLTGKFADKVGKVGLTDARTKQLFDLTAQVEEYGQNADMASSVGPGEKVRGFTEGAWLNAQLQTLFRLREKLIEAHDAVVRIRERVQDVLDKARKTYLKKIADEIKEGERDRKHALADIEKAKGKGEEDRDRAQKLLDAEMKKPKNKRDEKLIRQLKARIKAPDRLEVLREKVKAIDAKQLQRTATQTALKDKVIPPLVTKADDLFTGTNGRDELLSQLDTVHGLGSPMTVSASDKQLGVLGGSIFDVQMRLRDLAAEASPGRDPLTISELLEFADAVSLGVFQRGGKIPAYAMGGLHAGGLAMVGERGPEIADLPSGTRIHSNQESQKMVGGGDQYYDIYIGGEKIAEHVRAQLRQSESESLSRWRAGVVAR